MSSNDSNSQLLCQNDNYHHKFNILAKDIRIFIGFPLSILGAILNVLFFLGYTKKKYKHRVDSLYQIYFMKFFLNHLMDTFNYFIIEDYCNLSATLLNLINIHLYFTFLFYINEILHTILFFVLRMKLILNRFFFLFQCPIHLLCLSAFFLSALISLPNIFYLTRVSHNITINSSNIQLYYQIDYSTFITSQNGKFVFYTQYVFVLILHVLRYVFAASVIILLKKHFNNKIKIFNIQLKSNFVHKNLKTTRWSTKKFILLILTCFQSLTVHLIYLIYNTRNEFDSYTFLLLTCFDLLVTFRSYLIIFFFFYIDENFRKNLKKIILKIRNQFDKIITNQLRSIRFKDESSKN